MNPPSNYEALRADINALDEKIDLSFQELKDDIQALALAQKELSTSYTFIAADAGGPTGGPLSCRPPSPWSWPRHSPAMTRASTTASAAGTAHRPLISDSETRLASDAEAESKSGACRSSRVSVNPSARGSASDAS